MQNYDLFQICAMIWGVFGREGLNIDVWTNNAGGVWRGGVRGKKWRPAMETERKRFAYPAENEYIYIRNLNERKMEYMQLNTREGRGTPGRDGRFCLRVYRKNELARLYFPELDKKSALQGLARWIKRCRELEEALAAAGYDKNRKFFLKPEVELIVHFLGEP